MVTAAPKALVTTLTGLTEGELRAVAARIFYISLTTTFFHLRP